MAEERAKEGERRHTHIIKIFAPPSSMSDEISRKDEMAEEVVPESPNPDEENNEVIIFPRPPTVLFKGYNDPRHYSFLGLFHAIMDDPLGVWEKQQWGGGKIRRVIDKDGYVALQIFAPKNPLSTFIVCPRHPYKTLGIRLPWITIAVMSMFSHFSIHIMILDEFRIRRKFVLCNYNYVMPNGTTGLAVRIKVNLESQWKWNQIQFDLAALTMRAFGVEYVETTRVQVNASCRIRTIHFSEDPLETGEWTGILRGILDKIVADTNTDAIGGAGKSYLLVPLIPDVETDPAYVPSLEREGFIHPLGLPTPKGPTTPGTSRPKKEGDEEDEEDEEEELPEVVASWSDLLKISRARPKTMRAIPSASNIMTQLRPATVSNLCPLPRKITSRKRGPTKPKVAKGVQTWSSRMERMLESRLNPVISASVSRISTLLRASPERPRGVRSWTRLDQLATPRKPQTASIFGPILLDIPFRPFKFT